MLTRRFLQATTHSGEVWFHPNRNEGGGDVRVSCSSALLAQDTTTQAPTAAVPTSELPLAWQCLPCSTLVPADILQGPALHQER